MNLSNLNVSGGIWGGKMIWSVVTDLEFIPGDAPEEAISILCEELQILQGYPIQGYGWPSCIRLGTCIAEGGKPMLKLEWQCWGSCD